MVTRGAPFAKSALGKRREEHRVHGEMMEESGKKRQETQDPPANAADVAPGEGDGNTDGALRKKRSGQAEGGAQSAQRKIAKKYRLGP
jgi:hypothetical protein